jgi:hypothetical protein
LISPAIDFALIILPTTLCQSVALQSFFSTLLCSIALRAASNRFCPEILEIISRAGLIGDPLLYAGIVAKAK